MLPLCAISKIPHIVLADDDANECLLFKEALSNLHVPVVFSSANDGEMLFNMLDEQDFIPDFIFLGLKISGISGEDCLAVLKTRKELETVPIILYSESINPNDKDYCYNTSATEYFMKALFFLL